MNNKIKLAVAGAVLSAASVANAGIVIPAGDWTLDVNGNVNIFATMTNADAPVLATGSTVTGRIASVEDSAGEDTKFSMGTGLLPAWLGFTGTTRQNDMDVSFTISIQPSTSDNSATGDAGVTTTILRVPDCVRRVDVAACSLSLPLRERPHVRQRRRRQLRRTDARREHQRILRPSMRPRAP